MIQDILPRRFYNEFEVHTVTEDDVVLAYDGKLAYMNLSMHGIILSVYRELKNEVEKEALTYAFRIDETRYFIYEGSRHLEEQNGFSYIPWSEYREYGPMHELLTTTVGAQLSEWYASHKYCGCCGENMVKSEKERAMCYPSCKKTVYPTISPSVIVGITNKDELLLTKYANAPYKLYALVAGYSEIGESIEETARREVMEEVGLSVKNLRYYKSQPWPISSAMLFGFFAEVDGDPTITLQEEELKEGTWFKREDIPETTSTISLTNEMIEYFRNHPEQFEQ